VGLLSPMCVIPIIMDPVTKQFLRPVKLPRPPHGTTDFPSLINFLRLVARASPTPTWTDFDTSERFWESYRKQLIT
jgi:hypothetical protein